MNSKKASRSLIIISLVAAVAILISSYLLAGEDFSQTVTFLIIAVWFVPFMWLSARIRNNKPDAEKEPDV